MDFWAQHKDFVLKVLAGLGVFLVALIARGIVYGDELAEAEKDNRKWYKAVRGMRIAAVRDIQALEAARDKLHKNAEAIAKQIGWSGTADELELTLIERTLRNLRRYREDPGSVANAARQARQAILDNLNGGFGRLRGEVQDELGDEASERDIRVESGFGFENVTQIQPAELEMYLLQLELATRICRACIDACVAQAVKSIDEVRIETRPQEAIPGANRDFLREFPVRVGFTATQNAATEILRRLRQESPAVPIRELRVDRRQRPRDHVYVEITAVAVAVTLDHEKVPFAASKEEKRQ